MLELPLPPDEQRRLATLRSLHILDTPPEERFDRITRTAQRLFNVPIALVSLIDSNRQWFKSCQGLSVSETPRGISFCGHAILADTPLIIPDALLDPRFSDNPLVTGEPRIRFYAGQPLVAADGSRLGTLCIIDQRPRHLGEQEIAALRDIAAWAADELNAVELNEALINKHDSETHLRTVLDNVMDGIITLNEQGVIESCNFAAERIFEYSPSELTGCSFKLLMPEPYGTLYTMYLTDYLNVGQAKIMGVAQEAEGKRKDGSTFPIEFGISEVRLAEQRLFIIVVRDISERKKIERMKNEFISTVSHELRTPLTSIRGSLGLISGGVAGEIPEQAKLLVDIASKNSERLSRLINNILDVEKIESGKMDFTFGPVDITVLVEQALEANVGYGQQFAVEFVLENAVPGAKVGADSDRLMQVLTNLLSNAAKFSPEHSTVTVVILRHDAMIRVSVRDLGPGIPAEFHSRIFQKFAQADNSDGRHRGGSGLGLNISKALIEKMHGRIGFETEPGAGTTFYFDLPEWTGEEPETLSAQEAPQRVLICEDDPDVAGLLSEILRQGGFESDIALDAAQAKQLLDQHTYAAMTLDILLPGEDGIELLKELRTRKDTQELPVVVVSMIADQSSDAINGAAFGVIDWINKPFNPLRLTMAVNRAAALMRGGKPRILHVENDRII
ncbi:MAG: ATP-binding protein, partial [Gammaproteobacteria bacterium]